ncbi:MAG TPA: prepilin peptidase [Methylomirabilota bacterium]
MIVPAAVSAGAGAAAFIDVRTGRIPNPLTAAVALAGFGLAAVGLTGLSLAGAVLGGVLGLLLLLPGHVWGGTGAGDVKLLGALGTLLGPGGVLMAFLYGAIAGGVLAVVHARRRGRLGATLGRTAHLAAGRPGASDQVKAQADASRFAYGPALAVGAIVAALLA